MRKLTHAQTNTFNLNRHPIFMPITKPVTFTQSNYDKICTVQNAMNPQGDNEYLFDDALNRIITQCKLKSVLPKK